MAPNHGKKEINTCIHVCHHWWNNIDSKKWWKEKLFLSSKTVNVIYPNEENACVVPDHEKKPINTCMHDCHDWRNNIDSKKWSKEKLFLSSQSINVIYPNDENVFIVPNHEKKKINTCIHVCHDWRNNIDSKKWSKKKLFLSSQSINAIYANE